MNEMSANLELALQMVDAADAVTSRFWTPTGVRSTSKADGSPVTAADIAAEAAMLRVLRRFRPQDRFLGEELGDHAGDTGRRWIADGIDGTRFFAAGDTTWGTLLALEIDGEITVGVSSSPMQNRRWWATRGGGAFTAASDGSAPTPLSVSTPGDRSHPTLASLPRIDTLSFAQRRALEHLAGGRPADLPWSHQCRVAEGAIDACVWFAGDIWDHAAPSIIVEEAGGRFTDRWGGHRLDSRTGIYSNGHHHDQILEALRAVDDEPA